MYRKHMAAASAILFFLSAGGVDAYAAPMVLNEPGEISQPETVFGTEAAPKAESEAPEENIAENTEESEQETSKEAGFQPQIEAGFQPDTENPAEQLQDQEILETDVTKEDEEKTEKEIEIKSPVVEKTFRFFQIEAVYALAKRDGVYLYEEKDIKSDKIGKVDLYGAIHILSEEEDGWCYAESGMARGFVKKKYLLTGKKADKYIKINKEELETAEVLKEPYENEAFLYTQTTAYDTLAKKKYALAEKEIEIYDRIPDEQEKNEKESELVLAEENEEKEDPLTVGILKRNGLCYVLNDDDDDWLYVESGNVRGFANRESLKRGSDIKKEIKENGEDSYQLAKEMIKPEDNRACYYTITSVEEASVSGLIRTSMIQYAEQFLGNPYVWGGTSLTNGADCSGFVQTIYANFGYGIPRVAEDQAYCGTKIPVEDALPGDLIFYQRGNYIYHVVMSTGNGGTIEAQSSATGIVRSTVNTQNAVWAVRIISDEDTDILEYLKKKDMASERYSESVIVQPSDYGSFLGTFKLTAYCSCPSCCGIWSGGPTASGVMPQENHTVAMAGVPFGTELIINNQVYTVEDRGTPYGHVDIYMDDHNEALQFGVQYTEVYTKE